MLRQELAALRDRVTGLEAQLAGVKARADFDRENMLKFVLDRLKAMDVYIFGCFHKLFPNYARTADEFEKLIGWKPDIARHSYGQTKDGKEIL